MKLDIKTAEQSAGYRRVARFSTPRALDLANVAVASYNFSDLRASWTNQPQMRLGKRVTYMYL